MDALDSRNTNLTYGTSSGVRNPNIRSVLSLVFLTAFSLMLPPAAMLLVFSAGWDWWIIIPASMPPLFLLAILAYTWVSGMLEARRMENFLSSSRPLVRWTYNRDEWKHIIDVQWDEEKNDWKFQLFGLTFIFWLVGSLVAIMGILDGSGDINPIAATTGGAIFGLSLGIPIALGTLIATRWEYQHTNPTTAIGADEVFHNNQYAKADGKVSFIRKAKVVKEGLSSKLLIDIYTSSSLGKSGGILEWELPIPAGMERDVESMLIPQMRITKDEDDDLEETEEAEGEEDSNPPNPPTRL